MVVGCFPKKYISNNLQLDIAFDCKGAENRKIWKDIKTQIFKKILCFKWGKTKTI